MARTGPEAALIDGALRAGLDGLWGDGPIVLREPELRTGYPDLVFVLPRPGLEPVPQKRFDIDVHDLRFLHHVWACGRQSLMEAARVLCTHIEDVHDHATRLAEANLLRVADGVVVADEQRFGATKIVAVEAKMHKWRDALDQASANQWFASESYVLLPDRPFVRGAVDAAEERGIGVIVFDGKQNETVLHACRQELPASVGSWVVGEWSLRRAAAAHAG